MINEASERLRKRPFTATAIVLAAAGVCSLLAFLAVSEEGQVSRLQAQAAGVLTRPFINKGPLINQEYPEEFELDKWLQKALLKPFHAECPLRYQRPTLEELQNRDVRPYLFGGEQRPTCKNCHTAGSRWQRNDFCHYTFHHGRRTCPHDDQDRLMQHFLDRAHSGSTWAANMLQLTPCDLWPFIQGRTVWLMGDSITQEFMIAMECFFFEWYPDKDDEGPFGRVHVSNNTEVIEKSMKEGGVGPWCVPLPQGTRICHLRTNMGTDWADNVVPLLPELGAKPTDIVIGNFAVWINNDTEYEYNIAAFSKTYKKMADQLPFFIWRDASVQHFSTYTGDYNGAPYPFHCQPVGGEDKPGVSITPNGSLVSEDPELQIVLKGGWRNEIAYRMIPELGMPIMRTWNETVPIHFLHHHYNDHCGDALQGCPDCTHTCHPGYYQTWIYHMFETMMASQQQMLQHFSKAKK